MRIIVKWLMPLVGVLGMFMVVSATIHRHWIYVFLGLVLLAIYAVVMVKDRRASHPQVPQPVTRYTKG